MAWIDSSTSRRKNSPADIPKRDPNGLLKTHGEDGGQGEIKITF